MTLPTKKHHQHPLALTVVVGWFLDHARYQSLIQLHLLALGNSTRTTIIDGHGHTYRTTGRPTPPLVRRIRFLPLQTLSPLPLRLYPHPVPLRIRHLPWHLRTAKHSLCSLLSRGPPFRQRGPLRPIPNIESNTKVDQHHSITSPVLSTVSSRTLGRRRRSTLECLMLDIGTLDT